MNELGALNLNRLAVFVAVVEAGSLTAAAARLGVAKTMVSTHMQRLEIELGTRLLVRTTRRISLTEAGEEFYAASCKILRDVKDAVLAVGDGATEPRGTLRVTAPIDYGATVITPALVALRGQYPALKVELFSADRRFDLIAERIDVAIRLGRLADSSHQAFKIGSYTKWLVASPQFLERNGCPQTLDDLSRFPFISLSALTQPLLFKFEGPAEEKRAVRFKAAFSANTAPACKAATLAGGGIAVLTDFSISEDIAAGRLVRLLPEWTLPSSDIHAVLPVARQYPPKVRTFIDFLKNLA